VGERQRAITACDRHALVDDWRHRSVARRDRHRGDWGLVQWEQTIGDLLSSAGYCCAAYGKWHVGEGRGRWPTDKGFTEWYGPPRIYDEALWPTDPWYDPGRDPVSKMLSIKRGEADVTEGEQLTLDVRRDCDNEYLAKADRFIRAAVDDDTPFFCLLQPFLDAPARRSTR